jgi:uncharacterized repeat protein (TIGR01451 family)
VKDLVQRSASRRIAYWLAVAVFAVFGLGFLSGHAAAQEPEQDPEPSQSQQDETEDETRVQNRNTSSDASADSGDASSTNSSSASVGPRSNGGTVSQNGDNDFEMKQSGSAESGSCVAGSQVTGVSGGGNVTVNAQNTSSGAECKTGNATVVNRAFVSEQPTGADLSIDKTGAGAEPCGEFCLEVTFESTVTNLGPGPAQDVVFTDPAPSGWAVVGVQVVEGDGWDCSFDALAATCTKNEMAVGETAVFAVTFRNPSSISGIVTNTSAVSTGSDDPNPANDTDTCETGPSIGWTGCK